MNNRKFTQVALTSVVSVALLIGFLPTGTAFTSLVKAGDNDFVQTIDGFVAPLTTHFLICDAGTSGNRADDVVYFSRTPATATPLKDDVRLIAFNSKPAGSWVEQGDSVDLNLPAAACFNPTATTIRYADVNTDGRYNEGDYVYLAANGGAVAASAGGALAAGTIWTLRLTTTQWGAAGTLVMPGANDVTVYGAAGAGTTAFVMGCGATGATIIPEACITVFDSDLTGGAATIIARANMGDNLYLNSDPAVTAVAAGQTVRKYSVRLAGAAGAFGSQVKPTDADHVARVDQVDAGGAAVMVAGGLEVIGRDFGGSGNTADFTYYLDLDGSGTITQFDVRLTPRGTKMSGTTVTLDDTTETAGAVQAVGAWKFSDVNNNGRYDGGDYVYVSSGAGAALPATTAIAAYSIRITPAGAFAAGSMVKPGDGDILAGYTVTAATNIVLILFNGDLSTGALFAAPSGFNAGTRDALYVQVGTAAPNAAVIAGDLIPLGAVRLFGGAGAFGTVTKFGDTDFRPTLQQASSAAAKDFVIVRHNGGTTDSLANTIFVVNSDGDASGAAAAAGVGPAMEKDDLVIAVGSSPFHALKAGDLLKTEHNLYAGTALGAGHSAQPTASLNNLWFADVTGNGRYDFGDYLYASSEAAIPLLGTLPCGAAGAECGIATSTYTIRLTATTGGGNSYAAGTMVLGGDGDLQAWANAVTLIVGDPNVGKLAYFAANFNPDFTLTDRLYLCPTAVSAAAPFSLVSLNCLRMFGSFTGQPQPPVGPPVVQPPVVQPPVVQPPVVQPPVVQPPVVQPPVVQPPVTTTEDDPGTPGLEIVGILAGVAAAVLLFRRKD